jgi:glyoxylase-like metal-dependent hydrolase (beta-lactamase superfamily II)
VTPEAIATGLWRIGGGTWGGTVAALSDEGDANVYVLHGPEGALLVDSGSPEGRAAIAANLAATGVAAGEVGDLLLTHSHWDHTRGARAWQAGHGLRTHLNARGAARLADGDLRLVGAPLHGPAFPFEPFGVDHAVADGERFALAGIEVEARHMPGHTADSTVFLLEVAGLRTGIVGDVAFGPKAGRLGSLGFLCPLWGSDLADYVTSLRRLDALELELLVPGHGAPVQGRERVREAVRAALSTAERYAADPALRDDFGL